MAGISEAKILTFTVNFQGSRTVLHLPMDLKVGKAIQKAAEQFKTDPQGLTFLYHGLEITDDMTVGDALAKASNVTVVHLVRVSTNTKVSTARVPLSLVDNKGKLYAFCRECSSLSEAREVLTCRNCNKHEHFHRTSSEPIDHFSPTLDGEKLKGVCSCKPDEASYASVKFECGACPPGNSVSVLRQVRDNIHRKPCMKCAKTEDIVFRFACTQRHIMCLNCFSKYCQQMMSADNFHGFNDMGYSVGCPGRGRDCANTPVPDPHHFKIVDDDLKFYEKFIDKSVCAIDPGNNIMCTCKTLIDPGHGTEVTVQEPTGATAAQPTSDGLRWYQRVFRKAQPKPPAPRKRCRTSCSKCRMQYCVACKQAWHEGDCKPITDAIKKEEKAFPIDEKHAMTGCWPEEDK